MISYQSQPQLPTSAKSKIPMTVLLKNVIVTLDITGSENGGDLKQISPVLDTNDVQPTK